MKVELLWFSDCPNHEAAETMLREVMAQYGVNDPVERVEVEDEATGEEVKFPGSPTIRINGVDVEPGFESPDEYAPRCRVYFTSEGLCGLPERSRVEAAVGSALNT